VKTSARRAPRGQVRKTVVAGALALELVLAAAALVYAVRWNPDVPATHLVRGSRPFVYRAEVARPIADSVIGLTMFRGNATRTWYGRGPVPAHPRILWRYPAARGMCSYSRVGHENPYWCGSGWTGQPSVVERADGVEVIVGTYDRSIHFLDGATGRERRPSFATGDIIKGSVAVDPDGYPLIYSGSRDNFFHVIAIDRARPTELWRLSALDAPRPMWNDDWDGNAVIRDDYLFEGGENGWYYVVKLNRHYGADGRVAVDPKILARIPSFDDSLLADIRDEEVSIENSTALYGWTAYFANSGGAVWGVDLRQLRDSGLVRPSFRYWAGDDTDASIVIDEEGMLYVASELQRFNRRSARVGQLQKLDPRRRGDPRVWGIPIPPGKGEKQGGIWATPALFGHMLYVATNSGRLLGVDRDSGIIRWERPLPPHAWSSPVVVDSTLIVADCQGSIHAFDVRIPAAPPPEIWTFHLPSGACIESTPAVWNGRLYVGARDGYFYAIGDR
jgi:outer membrane protein assembly factor BamB